MISKNYRPTAAQSRFWTWIADNTYCAECGEDHTHYELHHVLGSSAKENHVHIGQWVLVKVGKGECHTTFGRKPKAEQVGVFVREVLNKYWRKFGEIPLDIDELMAVVCWSR